MLHKQGRTDTKWKKESKLYQKHGKVTLGNQERKQGIAQQEEVRAFRVLWIWPRQRPGIHSKTMLTLKPGEQTGQEGLASDTDCREKPSLHLGVEFYVQWMRVPQDLEREYGECPMGDQ